MNALIIGDEHCVGLEYVFDDIFQKEDITWYNKSAPGMGNEYISSMLFEWDNTIKTKLDYVFLQFTGLTRVDMQLRKDQKLKDYPYQVETSDKNWCGCGRFKNGEWQNHYRSQKLWHHFFQLNDQTKLYNDSFKHIFTAISFCKSKNIPFNWTSYYDYLSPPDAFTTREGHALNIPDYIDMSRHLGLYPLNYAYDTGQLSAESTVLDKEVAKKFYNICKDKFQLENK